MYLLFLRMHLECNQKILTRYFKRSKYFLRYTAWGNISRYQKLSENFIREFQGRVDWDCISINQKLSEEFIREFQDRVNWDWISCCQKLSEKIREFQDRVDWGNISIFQQFSQEFIIEFQDRPIALVVRISRIESVLKKLK